jgi:hypothetical protein
MITFPELMPNTEPALLTVAKVASLLLQVPPVPVVLNDKLLPMHTFLPPVMVPALGAVPTVILYVAMAVPQLVVTI